jgi:hypothetical protein
MTRKEEATALLAKHMPEEEARAIAEALITAITEEAEKAASIHKPEILMLASRINALEKGKR